MNTTLIIAITAILIVAIAAAATVYAVRMLRRIIPSNLQKHIDELKTTQSACRTALVHVNLPKLLEKVNDHEITIRGIGQIEDIAHRLEENAKTYQKVIIEFTQKVSLIDEKLSDISHAFSDHREEQSKQLKGIFDRLKKHDSIISEMQEQIKHLEKNSIMNPSDIIRQYLKLKRFARVAPINGYEVYERGTMKVSIDFNTSEYILTRPDREMQQGKYKDPFSFIINADKYRLL